jgi:hypothetical protein
VFSLGTLILTKASCYNPKSSRYFVSVDVSFFESTSSFSLGQSLSLASSLIVSGSLHYLLLLFRYLYLPFQILYHKFIDDLEIDVLLHTTPTLHLLCLKSLLHPPLLWILNIYLLPYDEVSVLVLNTLLLLLFPTIVFRLACIHLHVPYPRSLFLPLLSKLWHHVDGSMPWMRK